MSFSHIMELSKRCDGLFFYYYFLNLCQFVFVCTVLSGRQAGCCPGSKAKRQQGGPRVSKGLALAWRVVVTLWEKPHPCSAGAELDQSREQSRIHSLFFIIYLFIFKKRFGYVYLFNTAVFGKSCKENNPQVVSVQFLCIFLNNTWFFQISGRV